MIFHFARRTIALRLLAFGLSTQAPHGGSYDA